MKQWEGFPRGTPVIQRLETEPDGQAIIKSSWLPPGEGFTVGERRIEGGMVYVGSGLRAARGFSIEPCLIAPDMPVQWEDMDHRGDLMEYWPSYRLINPRSRGAYLHWLATGRRQPDAYVGYAFMFFYGLERRALFDLGPDSLHPDMNAITTEVKQLLEVYGKNGSFRRYSTNFLDFIAASRMSDPKSALADSPTGGRRAMSTILVGAGRHLAENQGGPGRLGPRILPPPSRGMETYRRHPLPRRVRRPFQIALPGTVQGRSSPAPTSEPAHHLQAGLAELRGHAVGVENPGSRHNLGLERHPVHAPNG